MKPSRGLMPPLQTLLSEMVDKKMGEVQQPKLPVHMLVCNWEWCFPISTGNNFFQLEMNAFKALNLLISNINYVSLVIEPTHPKG